jgi:hypothetical protein
MVGILHFLSMCNGPIDDKHFEYSCADKERGGCLLLRHGFKQNGAYVNKL